MGITADFREAVEKRDVNSLRIMMTNSLLVDRTFTEFDDMNNLARDVKELYHKHDGGDFTLDKSEWNDGYLNKLMVKVQTNFSKERIDHLKEVIENLPSVTAVPDYRLLRKQLEEASLLVDDIVLKNYLTKLAEYDVEPLVLDSDKGLDDINNIEIDKIGLFRISEMVYQKDEYSTYKFASVFNSVQNLNCGVFIIVYSDGEKTSFYMGIRSFDVKNEHSTSLLKDTLKDVLCGQFPGVRTPEKELVTDVEVEEFLKKIESKDKENKLDYIASVSCVAKNKDEEFTENERFIQGLEKLALAMQGKRYTAIILAKSIPPEQLAEMRRAYEMIYTYLSPFANMQLSYGTNTALNISDAFSSGRSKGSSHSTSKSTQKGKSISNGTSTNESTTKQNTAALIAKGVGNALLGVASIVTAPLTGGASLAAAGLIMAGQVGLSAVSPSSETTGTAENENHTESSSETSGETESDNEGTNETETSTKGLTSGTSNNTQLTRQDKSLINMLERIDLQLKRIEECESLGMWESAAYFLSDLPGTAEMAAGTYKALMKGEKSGVETSAINFWGSGESDDKNIPMLRKYIMNFIHPVFKHPSASPEIPIFVTASSFVSGNELAIQMGLPRKSVRGFPVIEHADFGKEVVKYDQQKDEHDFALGKVYSMGSKTEADLCLDRDSLTMHTFITGSTGSGKSNTVYEILDQLRTKYTIPFLVVEPTKGEYKNIFGEDKENVKVYGTNPYISPLLRINPFAFPGEIHVLEHLDRLIEIFNACWPMYASMPAILKKGIEKSYEESGWNLKKSENKYEKTFGKRLYPAFKDIAASIRDIMDSSGFGDDYKGACKASLETRLESLTDGIYGVIFGNEEEALTNKELFGGNVIVDLSRVGSMETKSLIMGMLVLKLHEYHIAGKKMNASLQHVTVLEEAHNLLKRTSTEQSTESANLIGKSVEMLANAIAEMRTYGEGFIIADQAPGLLDMSVIRNTNTKIIHRLPDKGDRELVGKAANLNDDQIEELAKLARGVTAVYQNDWIEPVLCQVKDFFVDEDGEEKVAKNGKKKKEDIYKAEKSDLTVPEDDPDECKKRKIAFYLLSNVINDPHPPKLIVDTLRSDILRSGIETGIRVKILDFLGMKNMPDKITDELCHIIAGLYRCPEEIIKKDISKPEGDNDWVVKFEDSITPRITRLNPDLRKLIMECIVCEQKQKEDNRKPGSR